MDDDAAAPPDEPQREVLEVGQGSAAASGTVDLLALLALGELVGFERLSADSALAPTLDARAELAAMAVAEFGHHQLLRERLRSLGADPATAMAPFSAAFEEFHQRTAPGSWLEGLVKAYVGDGIAKDFTREAAAFVDASTRELVHRVLEDTGQTDFAVEHVRAAIAADPRVGGRLALWGRRLVGEALSQAQRVAAEHDALSALLAGTPDNPGFDLAEVGRLFARLTDAHTRRMATLGLSA